MPKKQSIKKYLKKTLDTTMNKTQKVWNSLKGGFLNKTSKPLYISRKSRNSTSSSTSSSSRSSKNKKTRKYSDKKQIKDINQLKSSFGLLPFQLNK